MPPLRRQCAPDAISAAGRLNPSYIQKLMTRDASPYRLIFDSDFDVNSLKSLALGPDEFVYPTAFSSLTP